MISILFIVMILMAFFARSVSTDGETVPKAIYDEQVQITIQKQEKIDELNITLTERDITISDQKEEISGLLKVIEELKKQIKDLNITLTERDITISDQKEEISGLLKIIEELKKQIKDLNITLTERDITISDQKEEISGLLKIIEELKKQIKDLNLTLTERDITISDQKEKISIQQKKINNLEKEIAKLKKIIEDLEAKLKEFQETKDTILAKILDGISESRVNILNSIKDKLAQNNINVKIDTISGIVRFDENVINFRSGSYEPTPNVTKKIQKVAEVLEEELGCYSLGSRSKINISCNKNLSLLEAVQLEGHTDNVPLGAKSLEDLEDNLDLSARRAAAAFRVMISHRPALMEFRNANIVSGVKEEETSERGQPILSVSAYGEFRPVAENKRSTRSANRRIDLRIIMITPKNVEEARRLSTLINNFISKKGD
jgi:flagellar motor protein MotB